MTCKCANPLKQKAVNNTATTDNGAAEDKVQRDASTMNGNDSKLDNNSDASNQNSTNQNGKSGSNGETCAMPLNHFQGTTQPQMDHVAAIFGSLSNLNNNAHKDAEEAFNKMLSIHKALLGASTCSTEMAILRHAKELDIAHGGKHTCNIDEFEKFHALDHGKDNMWMFWQVMCG